MSSSKGLFWTLLAGGVTSGIAVYMYATKHGRAVRKDLSRKKNILIKKTNEVLKEGKDKANSYLREARAHGDILTKEISKVSDNYLVPAKKKIRNYKRPY